MPAGHPRAALLPFENLSGREEQGALFGRVFFAQLVASGALDMVEPGQVEDAMDSLGIRAGASPTPTQTRALGEMLRTPYILLGSVLESSRVNTGGADVPTAGATLRMIEASTGRVPWAGVHFRTGEDRETVFAWGRVRVLERLVMDLATEMLGDFRDAGSRYARRVQAEGSQ